MVSAQVIEQIRLFYRRYKPGTTMVRGVKVSIIDEIWLAGSAIFAPMGFLPQGECEIDKEVDVA